MWWPHAGHSPEVGHCPACTRLWVQAKHCKKGQNHGHVTEWAIMSRQGTSSQWHTREHLAMSLPTGRLKGKTPENSKWDEGAEQSGPYTPCCCSRSSRFSWDGQALSFSLDTGTCPLTKPFYTKHMLTGLTGDTCNPSTWKDKFEAGLGSIARHKKQKGDRDNVFWVELKQLTIASRMDTWTVYTAEGTIWNYTQEHDTVTVVSKPDEYIHVLTNHKLFTNQYEN